MHQLNEWRGLRDSYAKKAVAALARTFPTCRAQYWQTLIDETARYPVAGVSDLQAIAQEFIYDMADWSAVTRFCYFAEMVWEIEIEELLEHYQGRDARAA